MSRFGRLASVWVALSLSACAASLGAPRPYPLSSDGWTPQVAELRSVSLGLPGGTQLADGVTFAGGLQISAGHQADVPRLRAGGQHRCQRPDAALVAVGIGGPQVHGGGTLQHDPVGAVSAIDRLARRKVACGQPELVVAGAPQQRVRSPRPIGPDRKGVVIAPDAVIALAALDVIRPRAALNGVIAAAAVVASSAVLITNTEGTAFCCRVGTGVFSGLELRAILLMSCRPLTSLENSGRCFKCLLERLRN